MKKIYLLTALIFTTVIFFGFSGKDNPRNNNQNSSSTVYYSDNFDLPNDTNGLKARGYLVYYRGTGPQDKPTWVQGRPNVFAAYNGDPDSYVGSTFDVATGLNAIDNWLVLPDIGVNAGDTLRFACQGISAPFIFDSVRVMYNDQGGTTPESAGWVELDRFRANNTGTWELKSYVLPTESVSGSIALRYTTADGGPFGSCDFVGIDALELIGDGVLPVELSGFVSTVSDNDVTLNWSTASETNNSGFDIERYGNGHWSKIGNVSGNGTTASASNYSFTDLNLNSGSYSYRLKQIDFNGNFEYFNLSSEVNVGVPSQYSLSQNYPNPFNPSTSINYEIPNDGFVSLKIFDMSGKEVVTLVNEVRPAGYYSYNFNASGLSSGVYFYTISANDFTATRKMIMLK